MSSSTVSAQVDRSHWREFLLIVTITTVVVAAGLLFLLQGDPGLALIAKIFLPLVWFALVLLTAVHTLRLRALPPVLFVTLTVAALGVMQLKQLK